MPPKRTNVRLTVDESYMQGYISKHFSEWFPGCTFLKLDDIYVQRNFLGKFEAVAIRYKVKVKCRGKLKTLTLRAQARAPHHIQAASPLKTYRVATYLYEHGMKSHVYRPLAYNREANFFFYESTPGKNIEKIIYPVYFAKKPAHPRHYILRFVPEIGRLLRMVHSVKKLKGVPPTTRSDAEKLYRDHIRLIRKYHPQSIPPVTRALKRCREAYPQYYRKLYSPARRRLTHGDVHPGNFINLNGGLSMIDFGDATLHDPMNDIARFIVMVHFLLRIAHRDFQPDVMNDLRILFLKHYFKKKTVSPMDRYALNYFAVLNLVQIMSIQSFSNSKRHVGKVLRKYTDSVDYFTERLETLTY